MQKGEALTSLNDLINDYPALAEVLIDPQVEARMTELTELGLAASIRKYMGNADRETWNRFLDACIQLDLAHLRHHREALLNPEENPPESNLEPLKADPDQAENASTDLKKGLEALAAGRIGTAVFAGGAGTRFFKEWPQLADVVSSPNEALRSNWPEASNPKGMFPISPVQGLSYYQRVAAETLEAGVATGCLPPLLFMTSRLTHSATEAWLDRDPLWGMPKDAIILFRQGEIPRLDAEGDLIIQPDGDPLWTGNGHGGIYAALSQSSEGHRSVLEDLKRAGVEHLLLGNVDNAALSPLEPTRIGYHLRKNNQFTLTVVRRSDPTEKVGMTCRYADTQRVEVIEYSVLDPALSAQPDPAGGLRFDGAHINSNLLALEALRSDLPGTLYTDKPVKVGERSVASSTLEFLNQHLSGLLDPSRVSVYEGMREAYFLPTKAIVGRDSVESTIHALSETAANTLERLGANIACDQSGAAALVEWHPCMGGSDNDLSSRGLAKGWHCEAGSRLYLCVRHGLKADLPPFSSGLNLERTATFILRADHPYGDLEFDPATRRIRETPESAGKVSVGRNVRIQAGIRVVIDIEGDGRLTIADDTVFADDVELRVPAGQHMLLGIPTA